MYTTRICIITYCTQWTVQMGRGIPCKAARKFRCEHCRMRSSKSALYVFVFFCTCTQATKTLRGGAAVGTLAHQLRTLPCRFVPAATAIISGTTQRPRLRSALDRRWAGRPRDVAVASEKRLELRPARHSLVAQSFSAQNATRASALTRSDISAEAYAQALRINEKRVPSV